MRIVFISNYFNHHQKYISNEFLKKCASYNFISTSEMRDERKKLGYGETIIPDYVNQYNSTNKTLLSELIGDCDVAIIGSAPQELINNRIKNNKLIFRYSERPFKLKRSGIKYIPRFIKWHLHNPFGKPIYLLCASAYTYYDYSQYALFSRKAYKWGYFPEMKRYDVDRLLEGKNKTRILWCGRFLDWKHPDDVLTIVKRLKAEGYSFELNFIGTGEMEDQLKIRAAEASLDGYVTFLGSMKPSQVRSHMEQAGIYLFTSDRQEGWGAVLNESMNSGCAVVASHAIGAVPYLVKNNENGLIYQSGNVDMLYEKVKYLLDHPEEQKRLGKAAYRTITETWNAEVAAQRLINLAQHILNGEESPDLYENGPCSRAEIIKDDWFHE